MSGSHNQRTEYTYEYDENRSSEARLAIFIDTPCDPDPEGDVPPGSEGPAQRTLDYQCFLFDLCKTGMVPKHDWNTPAKNTLSLVSLSDERLNVKFKGTDGPDIVNVKKLDYRPQERRTFIDGLEEISGLVIVQDIGYDAPINFEEQLITICGLVLEAKGLAKKKKLLAPHDIPIPVALFAYGGAGRPRKSSKMRLEELTKDTSWVYRYIRGLDHEADIASGIVTLVSQIEKRGMVGYRLWPGVVKAVRPKKSDKVFTPPPRTDQEVTSPALSSTLVTPHLTLQQGETETVPIVQSTSPDMDGSSVRDTTPEKLKRTRLGTPIPIPTTPGMTASGSGRSLSSYASNRSLRRQASPVMPIEEEPETPDAGPSARPDTSPTVNTAPLKVRNKSKESSRSDTQPVVANVIPPTPPAFSDTRAREEVRPVPSSLPSFENPPRRAAPPPSDPLDQDVVAEPYVPMITTAGEGPDSILHRARDFANQRGNSGRSIRSQPGVMVAAPITAPGQPQRWNFDEPQQPPEEVPEAPANTGFDLFGVFKSKSTSKKGKGVDRRPGIHLNTFNAPTQTHTAASSDQSFSTDPVVRVPPKLSRMGVGEPSTPGAMVQMRQSPQRPRDQPRPQQQEERSGWLDDDVTGGNTGGLCGTGCIVS